MEAEKKSTKAGYWNKHSREWKSSGLSQKAYCEQAGISYASFVYQHKQMAKKVERTEVKFIEKKPFQQSPTNTLPRLQLILPNGIRIGIEGELNSELLETEVVPVV